MKIAIQGHSTRGKEVIQILKSLGGINECPLKGDTVSTYYYIDYGCNNAIHCHDMKYVNKCCKKYTLEEFEKEFPFKIGDEVIFPVKIGWASGKVTGLTYVEDQLKYEVDARIGGYRHVEPRILQLYPMKKERNITLTLDKAKEWYKKGGELREIALQAFTEKELNPLPRSWEEFCINYSIKRECWVGATDCSCNQNTRIFKNWTPSKKSAEAHLAMMQLEQLRNCWIQGWEPDWNDKQQTKYCVVYYHGEFKINLLYETRRFLSFPTIEMAEEFLECFRDLIEKAGDLI